MHSYNCKVNLREGLHARPVMGLWNLLQNHPGEVSVGKYVDDAVKEYVNAKDPMELLLLAAPYGALLHFRFESKEHIESITAGISEILGNEQPFR